VRDFTCLLVISLSGHMLNYLQAPCFFLVRNLNRFCHKNTFFCSRKSQQNHMIDNPLFILKKVFFRYFMGYKFHHSKSKKLHETRMFSIRRKNHFRWLFARGSRKDETQIAMNFTHKVIMNFNVFNGDRINLHLTFTHVKIDERFIYELISSYVYIFNLKCVVFWYFRNRLRFTCLKVLSLLIESFEIGI
jgi:hypothetical protein